MPFWSKSYLCNNICSLLKRLTIISLAFGLVILGCQSSGNDTSDVKLDWEIKPDPPIVGMATMNITMRDSTNQLIKGADIKLEGNMSHPGMEPVTAAAKEVEPGQYSAKLEFTMGGDWFILVESTLPDDRVVERQINIPGVRSE